jgi:hypothetical protein
MHLPMKKFYAGRSFNPNTPASVAGLALWYDANDATSVISSAGAISQWSDKSGGARHATQVVAANQPTYALGANGGRNAVKFLQANAQQFSIAPALTINVSGYSFFGVFFKGAFLFEGFGGSATPLMTVPEFTGNGYYFFDLNTSDVSNFGGTAFPKSNVWQQCTMLMSGVSATSALYVNGAPIPLTAATVNSYNAATIDRLGSGDNTTCEGMMAELLFYNTIVSDTNRIILQTYLRNKWGTP